MRKVEFSIGGSLTKSHDAAYVMPDEEPLAAVVEAAIQAISTDVLLTCGGETMHLAAWQDPDHWADDWREKGIDPDDVASLVAAEMGAPSS